MDGNLEIAQPTSMVRTKSDVLLPTHLLFCSYAITASTPAALRIFRW